MERGRAWRRYKLESFFVKRIKRQLLSRYVYIFWGRYPVKKYDPLWIDKISSKDILIYKSIRTPKWTSRNKIKWGKKGKKNFDWSSNPNTRPKSKIRLRRELMEYGY